MSYNQTPKLALHVAKKISKQLNKKNGLKTLQHLMLLYSKSNRRKLHALLAFDLLDSTSRQPDDFYHLHPLHLQYKLLEKHLRRRKQNK